MKATKAFFLILFQTFGSVLENLNVWPFKSKLQRPTLLYFFKRLGPGMKSLIFDHSGESYKGLLSYNFLNVWVRVWNPKCLTIQMKAEGPTFLYFFKRLRPSMNWNPKCVTIQMKAIEANFPVLFQTFGSIFEILMFDHSNESYKGLLSYTFSNFWIRVWNPKCLTIQMKAAVAILYFPMLFQLFGLCMKS